MADYWMHGEPQCDLYYIKWVPEKLVFGNASDVPNLFSTYCTCVQVYAAFGDRIIFPDRKRIVQLGPRTADELEEIRMMLMGMDAAPGTWKIEIYREGGR